MGEQEHGQWWSGDQCGSPRVGVDARSMRKLIKTKTGSKFHNCLTYLHKFKHWT